MRSFHFRRGLVEHVEIGSEKSELIEALGEGAADADDGRILREDLEAGNPGEILAKLADDVIDRWTFASRFESKEEAVRYCPSSRCRRLQCGT